MLVMIFGVIALCQPWNLFLHSYGATVILAGLIMFNIFSRIGPPKRHQLSPWEGPPGH
jgi:disulfide bond formation protein DsbB